MNVEDAILELESGGFEARQFNSYQIRISVPDLGIDRFKFWDWYFTTGSLVENGTNENGVSYVARDGTFNNVKKLTTHLMAKIVNPALRSGI